MFLVLNLCFAVSYMENRSGKIDLECCLVYFTLIFMGMFKGRLFLSEFQFQIPDCAVSGMNW